DFVGANINDFAQYSCHPERSIAESKDPEEVILKIAWRESCEFSLVRHPERERGTSPTSVTPFRSCEVLRCAQDDMAFVFATLRAISASRPTNSHGLRASSFLRHPSFVLRHSALLMQRSEERRVGKAC